MMPKKNSFSPDTALSLDQYIPALITIISNKLSSGGSACYRKHFNVGIMEWRILAMLRVETNVSANRISQSTGLDKAAVSRTLKQLQKSELVEFIKNESDGRSSFIKLTTKGESLHDQILEVALAREEIFLDGISPKEQEFFLKILNKMNQNLVRTNAYDPTVNP
jgi:DNA-binding MarR family transcriptional regulator